MDIILRKAGTHAFCKSLQQLGIETPKQGMKLSLTVQIGLFQTAQETFLLSGWYTDYTDSQASVGYVSEEKERVGI